MSRILVRKPESGRDRVPPGLRRRRIAALALWLLAGSCAQRDADGAARELEALRAEYVELLLEADPALATELGAHEHDGRLADFSQAGVESVASRFEDLQRRLLQLDPNVLPEPADRIEHALLESRLRAEILERREIRSHARNPMLYPLEISRGLLSLASRPFAPAARRMQSATGRLLAVPALLAAARANLQRPPELYTRAALDIARSTGDLLAVDYSEAFGPTGDLNLRLDFETARGEAAIELGRFIVWLEEELLPRSSGDFALGQRLLSLKLEAEEMLDVPPSRLLEIAERELDVQSAGIAQHAAEIFPGAHPRLALAELERERPGAGELRASVERAVERARGFAEQKGLIGLPPVGPLRVVEAPRWLRFAPAALSPAGALEEGEGESYYYVAPPEPEWPAGRSERHLAQFNRPALSLLVLRETYPGRYAQSALRRRSGSLLRRAVPVGSYTEGWAHYSEQMMIEEGYGEGDARLRLALARESVRRLCRLVAALKLHTHRMTLAEAARLFAERAMLEFEEARHEAERSAADPACLNAALGRMQILKLREDLRASSGAAFSLPRFHDQLLSEGKLPIPLLRRVMMPGDERVSL